MHYLSLFLSIGLLFPFSMLLSQEGESDRNVLALDSVKEYLEAKQFPQAEKLLANTAFPVYGENPQTDSLALAAEYAYATLWYQTGRFSQALPAFEALLEKQIQFYGPENTQVAQTYNDIGITLGYSGNYERAKENYLKALEIARNIHDEDHPQVITALNNIGVFYERQGDYEKALEHYQYSLQLRLQRYGSSHEKIADSYNNIGNIYFYTNRIPEAKDYYQRTLDMYLKELGSRHISVGYAYMNLAISYALSGDLAEAEKLFLRDLSIRRSVYGESHPFVAYCYDNLGQLYQMQQDYEAAQKSYLRSLAISQEAYGETHPFIAQSYANLGMLNTLRERPGEAENFYYQALAVLGAYGNGAFGSPSQVRDLPKCLRILFDLLKLQRKDPTALEQSWESVQFASTLIDYMRQSYRAEGSRLYLQQYALPIFELGIETALALHEQNREPSLLESAFAISERASGVLLQQAFAGEKALSLPEIPASLREEEQNLRSLLNFYDQQLSSLQDSALENSYLVARFNTQARYDSLQNELNQQYPRYQSQKKQLSLRSPQYIRENLLEAEQALLEYFVGDSIVYAFLITEDTLGVWPLPVRGSLTDRLQELRQSVYRYFLTEGAGDSLYLDGLRTYRREAYRLYQELWQPIESRLPDRLFIIPQAELGYLPFEILLKDTVAEVSRLKNYAFLLKDHSISYGFSAGNLSLMQNQEKGAKADQGLLAVAPVFEDLAPVAANNLEAIRGWLGPLPYTAVELEKVQSAWQGKSTQLKAQQALKDDFLSLAPRFQVLHIATHGQANDQQPERSFLAFRGQGDSAIEKLYLTELYNLRLTADLVVLSACETGIGKLNRGEGIASLARGFAQAGAASILTTLWSVNDAQTTEVMSRFYAELSRREAKDRALQKARLGYLAEQDDYHNHPFFWGGYIAIGDITPLGKPKSLWIWITGIVIFLLVSGTFFYRKRRHRP